MELRTCVRTAAAVALIGLVSACGAAGNVAVPQTTTPLATTTTTTTTTTTVSIVPIPSDLVGKSAKDVLSELNGLGFVDVQAYSPDGMAVTLTDAWNVVSIDGGGVSALAGSRITLRVEPKATTTVAPPPPPRTTQQAPPPAYTPPPPAPAPTEVYYKNCDAARAAGAAPIYRGQPGYRAALDRDNDGIACE